MALEVIGEVGTDMTRWPTAKHFALWLGLSPNNRVTRGRIISSRTKPSANRAAKALRLAANALYRSNSALGSVSAPQEGAIGTAPRSLRPRRTSWLESSTPCYAMVNSTLMPARNTMRASTIKGPSVRRSGGRRSWATNCSPYPITDLKPLIYPWQQPRPARENLSYSIGVRSMKRWN